MENRISRFLEEEKKLKGEDWTPETLIEKESFSIHMAEMMASTLDGFGYRPEKHQEVLSLSKLRGIAVVMMNYSLFQKQSRGMQFLESMELCMGIMTTLCVNGLIVAADLKKQP